MAASGNIIVAFVKLDDKHRKTILVNIFSDISDYAY